MRIEAVTLDAYGTLVRNESLRAIPERIVADYGLAVAVDEVWRRWTDLYFEATQTSPFRTLREIACDILGRVLRAYGVAADPAPHVEHYLAVTTRVELYPGVPAALAALDGVPSGVVSNADHEQHAAWTFALPVRFVLLSEAIRAYKPSPAVFAHALGELGLRPEQVLYVGDSDIDDVKGAREAGLRVAWVNRDGRARRAGVPAPDFEIRDLGALADIVRAR